MNAPLDRSLLDPASPIVEDRPRHPWRFFSAGGFTQVRLDTGADLVNLKQLDQKLWVALSCPVQGLEFDRRTLALMDTDNDGHIRAPELIAAIDWAAARLASPDVLAQGGPLPLAALDIDSAEGARLLTSARHVLDSLGKGGSDSISVEDVSDSDRIFSGMAFNGDGIITAAAACDEALGPVFAAIVDTLGGVPDRSGAPGIDGARADRFFTEAEAWLAWQSRPQEDAALLPLGADTGSAFAALAAIRAKADDYFTRCSLAEFDPRAAELMNGAPEEIRAVGARSLTADDAALAALPIAYVQAGGALPLESGINPAWTAAVAALRDKVVRPLLGDRDSLGAGEWEDLKVRFAAYQAWQAARPDTPLAGLETARLQAFLAPGIRAAIDGLLSRDLALAPEANAIAEVERLVRYVRDLEQLANNFVSFRNFYSSGDKAIFQAGTLFLDGRSCELCIKVLDPARHGILASLSGVYLAYCDCVRGSEKMSIAAAFTAGDSDQLMVGRNGIFYDREGKDWDATITKIVDHPISIRQAFWAPYRKATRLISEQMEKFAATRARGVDDVTSKLVNETGSKVESGARPGPAPTPFDAARFAGIFAALGLAIGAIGTALASVVTGFLGLEGWQMPLAMAGLFLAISGPSVAMAFFKLRNRNLGPILDANGWAVNARARINIPFGTALTRMARLPDGAERSLRDPYAAQRASWKFYLVLGMLVAAALTWLAFNTDLGAGLGLF
ncbi:hypothetical protein [Massilia alkalitolerans]|uniref:hypothetical protein n=1 Tax=Massilia alkalitolerans TaxID=286638 RepID=UPI00040F2264|nr:hypothetical protein [Massilia alkalitolerans]